MRFNTIRYYLKEGLVSIRVNGMMSFASIISVIVSLLIFGLFTIVSSNMLYVAQQFNEKADIRVFLDDAVTQEKRLDLEEQFKKIPNVTSVEFINKDDALKDFGNKFLSGDQTSIESLKADNPLPNTYKINIKDLNSAQSVTALLTKLPGIVKVSATQPYVDSMIKASSVIRMASYWLSFLFALLTVFIVSNTIKLTVFARRREINIMKYIGATNWFIRWPFIIEGVVIGLIGAAIAFFAVYYGYDYVYLHFGSYFKYVRLQVPNQMFALLVVSFAGFGTLIGAVGSAMSIRKYLKV